MVKIDEMIFGYRSIKISPDDLSSVTSFLLQASIPAAINNDGSITVRERDFERTKGILQGRIDFTYSKPKGIYGIWKRVNHKWSIILSLSFAIVLIVFLSQLVWDIRVEGNENISYDEVIKTLSECDFEIGDFWPTTDKGKIETSFLLANDKVSWININRRGTVAYIKLIEKEETEEKEDTLTPLYSNVISTADCVIEEITVRRGTAMVKVGDVVKKGDILVAGVLPGELGGGFCAADATVIGRISDRISVKIDRNEEKISYKEGKLQCFSLKIFKISLNIFKLYGNLTKECDIIEDEITYSLFKRYKLPISVQIAHLVDRSTEIVEHTDEELVRIATERLNFLTTSKLESSDLLRIRTDGAFTDDGYLMTSDIVFLSNVGEIGEFVIE